MVKNIWENLASGTHIPTSSSGVNPAFCVSRSKRPSTFWVWFKIQKSLLSLKKNASQKCIIFQCKFFQNDDVNLEYNEALVKEEEIFPEWGYPPATTSPPFNDVSSWSTINLSPEAPTLGRGHFIDCWVLGPLEALPRPLKILSLSEDSLEFQVPLVSPASQSSDDLTALISLVLWVENLRQEQLSGARRVPTPGCLTQLSDIRGHVANPATWEKCLHKAAFMFLLLSLN